MNGWKRIGVVLSLLFGIPTFLIAYSENDSAYIPVGQSLRLQDLLKSDEESFWAAVHLQAIEDDPEQYAGCDQSTVEMTRPLGGEGGMYILTCDKTVSHAIKSSILWGLLPGFILWIIGITVAWVISGFRRQKT